MAEQGRRRLRRLGSRRSRSESTEDAVSTKSAESTEDTVSTRDTQEVAIGEVAAPQPSESGEDTVALSRTDLPAAPAEATGTPADDADPDADPVPDPSKPTTRPRISRTPPPPAPRPASDQPTDLARRRRARRPRTGLRRALPWLAAVLVVAVVASGVWALWFSSLVTARRVEVRGASHVPVARVERAAAVPTGRPLVRVDLDAVRRRVERLPVVRSADVSRSWPHAVRITVVERTPVAVIDRGSGLQAIDASGVLFRSFARRPAGLPLVRTDPDVQAEALSEGAKVVTALRVDGGDLAGRVDYVDVKSVDQISLVLRSGREVTWGSADQSRQKAEVLVLLLRQKGRYLDVSVPGRPTTHD